MQKSDFRKNRRFGLYLVSEKLSNTKGFSQPFALGFTATPDEKGTERPPRVGGTNAQG